MTLDKRNSIWKICRLGKTPIFLRAFFVLWLLLLLNFSVDAGQIELFLVDNATGQDIRSLHNGDIINLSEMPSSYSIRAAVLTDIRIGSVHFKLNDQIRSHSEREPYIFGQLPNGTTPSLRLTHKTHKLETIAYTSDANMRVILAEQLIYFSVVPNRSANQPPSVSVSYFTGVCSGEDFSLQIDATDLDGDELTYRMEPGSVLPPSSILDDRSGIISGRALGDGSSSYEYKGSIRVSDEKGLFTVVPFLIEVYHCDMKEILHSFSLVNTVTGEEIEQYDPFLEPEITLDLAKLPVAMTFRVNYDPNYVGFIGSVKWYYFPPNEKKNVIERIENRLPYTVNGQESGKYRPFLFKYGNSTIGAQVFAGPNGTSRKIGSTVYLSVNVINSETGDGVLDDRETVAKGSILTNAEKNVDQILLEYQSAAAGDLYAELWNQRGITYFRKLVPVEAGQNFLSLETETIPEGTYFLQIRPPEGPPSLVTLRKLEQEVEPAEEMPLPEQEAQEARGGMQEGMR